MQIVNDVLPQILKELSDIKVRNAITEANIAKVITAVNLLSNIYWQKHPSILFVIEQQMVQQLTSNILKIVKNRAKL